MRTPPVYPRSGKRAAITDSKSTYFYRISKCYAFIYSPPRPVRQIPAPDRTDIYFTPFRWNIRRKSLLSLSDNRTMAQHNQLGKSGETIAAEYLTTHGYIVRDINWRSGKKEIDIVAYRDKTLVIVEVKTRKSDRYELPQDAVSERKIRNLMLAADAYIRAYDIRFDIRFDIITLIGDEGNFRLEHIEDAFFPPLTTHNRR